MLKQFPSLLPYATVMTPNLFEAAQLAGMEAIKTIDEAKEAAKRYMNWEQNMLL